MKSLLNIFYYKIKIFVRYDRSVNTFEIIKSILSSNVYLGFAVGAYFFTISLIRYLLEIANIGSFLLHQFISIILFIFFIAINIGNIFVAYTTLFKSHEVSFLFTTPIKHWKLFLVKFLDNFFYSSGTLLLILFSILLGYFSYFNLSFLKLIILIVFGFIPFMLIAASTGVIILLTVINFAQKFGFKKVIVTLSSAYIAFIFLFFKISSPMNIIGKVMQSYPDINKYFGDVIPAVIKYLPNNWISEAMFWLSFDGNEIGRAFNFLAVLTFFSLLIFSLLILLGKGYYYKFWLILNDFRSSNSEKKKTKIVFSFAENSNFHPITESIIKRDFHLFFREASQVFHLGILLLLIIIFLSSVGSMSNLALRNPLMQTVILMVVVIFNILLISTLSLRFIFPLLSLEGLNFWKILSSPVNVRMLLFKRLVPWFGLFLILSTFMNAVSLYKFSKALIFPILLVAWGILFIIFFMNFGMGGFFVRYKEKSAIRIASSQGASLTFLLSLVIMIFVIVALFLPLQYYNYNIIENRILYLKPLYYAAFGIFFFGAIAGYLFWKIGVKTLERDF